LTKFEDKTNVMALAWHMPISLDKKIIGVAVDKENYTHELIKKSNEFSLNLLSIDQIDRIWYAGTVSGRKIDKIKELELELENGLRINTPHIKTAMAYLECKVEKEVDLSDHTLFLSKVLYAWANDKYFKECWLANAPIPLHMGKKYFTSIGKYVTPPKK